MKALIIAAALALLAGSTAIAAPRATDRNQSQPRAQMLDAYAAVGSPTVIADGKVIGRDPDALVRLAILRDYGQENRE